MEEGTYVEKALSELKFAARAYRDLKQRPKAFKQLIAYKPVITKLVNDPVFFAVLMCGDNWLIDAPNHQKLLQDQSPRQVAVCGRGWEKA